MTRAAKKSARGTALRRVVQVAVVAAAVVFIWRFARDRQADLSRVEWRVDAPLLILASIVWALAFGGLVLLWARSLRWWGTGMRGAAALRAFFLANLARYVPGAVWQFAGLAALAAAQGVPPIAATAAVLWQQAALLATGLAVALALAPVALAPVFERLGIDVPSLGVRLAGALALVAVITALLPSMLAPLRRLVERRFRDVKAVPHAPHGELAVYLAFTILGWIGYGVAFSIFARAVLGSAAPPFVEGGAIYIAAYVLGILVIVVPGGIGIREGALVVSLTPLIGADRAAFLAIASRIWLTALEILGAVLLLAAGVGRARGSPAPEPER